MVARRALLLLLLGAALQQAAGQTASCSLSISPASLGSAAAALYAARVDCLGLQAPLLVARPEVVVYATFNGQAANVTTSAGQRDNTTALLSLSLSDTATDTSPLHLVLTRVHVSQLGSAASPLPYSALSIAAVDVLDINNCSFSNIRAQDAALLVQPGVGRRPMQVRIHNSTFTSITTNATLAPATGALTFTASEGNAGYHSIQVSDSRFDLITSAANNSTGGAVAVRGCNPDARFLFNRATFTSNIIGTVFNSTVVGSGSGAALFVGPGCSGALESCTFFNNTAAMSAGAALLSGTPSVNITDCVFDANQALGKTGGVDGGGAVAVANASEIRLRNVTVSNNRARTDGVGMMVYQAPSAGTRLLVSNSTFLNNTVFRVIIYGTPNLTVSEAGNGGGGMSVTGPAVIELDDVTFTGNSARDITPASGGALRATASRVTANRCAFINNAAASGGAMELTQQSHITLTSCNFTGNQAGAIKTHQSVVAMRNVSFVANSGGACGGAVCAQLSNVTIEECSFVQNDVRYEGGKGGALGFMSSIVNMSRCHLEGNRASSYGGGGAIHSTIFNTSDSSSALVISHSSLVSNRAMWGGAILAERLPLLRMHNVTIDDNYASNGGGGAVNLTQCDAAFVNCTFRRNRAAYDPRMWNNNATSGDGAAIFATTASPLDGDYSDTTFTTPARINLTNCLVEYNNATTHVAAVRIHSYASVAPAMVTINSESQRARAERAHWLSYQIKHTAWIQNCTFRGNNATGGGAAMAASGPGTDVTIVASRFLNNSALVNDTGRGGAISLSGCFAARLTDCEVSGNAANTAGGISSDNVRLLFINSTRLLSNTATLSELGSVMARDPSGSAGALDILPFDQERLPPMQVYDWPGPSGPLPLPLPASTIQQPGPPGVSWPDPSFPLVHIQDSTFEANVAESGHLPSGGAMGGAISVRAWPFLLVERCNFTQNRARAGAAVNIACTSGTAMQVVMSNSSFNQNVAIAEAKQGMGGAAIKVGGVSASCSVALHDSHFLSNVATNGGAVFAQGQNVTLTAAGCSFLNNVALSSNNIPGNGGSLCAVGIGQLVLQGSNVSGSRAGSGGGLYISDVPDVQVMRCLITTNTALAQSESLAGGGMAWVSLEPPPPPPSTLPATITVQDSTFDSNIAAASFAGGLAVLHQAARSWQVDVQVLGSVFRHNRAVKGGGMYQAGSQSTLVITHTAMFNNTAATGVAEYGTGGGLAVEEAASLLLNHTHIHGCTAARGAGVAVNSVTQVEILDCNISDNAAIGSLPYAMPASLEALSGTGAGLWLSGDGSRSLVVNGSTFRRNHAGLFGGGMALFGQACTPQPASANAAAPSTGVVQSEDVPCLHPVIVGNVVRDNFAYDSGGGIFSSFAFGLLNCSDLGSAAGQPSAASSTFPSVCGDLNNTAQQGYGPTLATSPTNMIITEVATQRTGAGARPDSQGVLNSTLALTPSTFPSGPLTSSTSYQTLVFPSGLASSSQLLQLVVWDSLNQTMFGPWFGQTYVVSISSSSPGSATQPRPLGYSLVVYEDTPSARGFLIDAMVLITYGGRIHDRHPLTFTLAPAVDPAKQIVASTLDAVIPPCVNGEASKGLGISLPVPGLGTSSTCERCIAGAFIFTKLNSSTAAAAASTDGGGNQDPSGSGCWACPSGASCPGGAVILPDSGYWHSHPQSTNMVQCLNGLACARSENWTGFLSDCKEAWFSQLHHSTYTGNVSAFESEPLPKSCVALGLSRAKNMSLLSLLSDGRTYSDLLCNDGYGGNLCGVCVPTQGGMQTGMQGNFQCSPCSERWRTIAISVALFLANMLMVAIQVMGNMGEQLQSCNLRSLETSDLISLLITHLQYLVVILKLNIQWPPVVVGLSQFAVTFASISEQCTRATSISCLSDGSPEAQATYIMVWGLASPAVLIIISVCSWCLFWLFRHRRWYKAKGDNSLQPSPSGPSAAALSRSPQITQDNTSTPVHDEAGVGETGDQLTNGPSQSVAPVPAGLSQSHPLASEVKVCVGDGTPNPSSLQHADIEGVEIRITLPALGSGTHETRERAERADERGTTAAAPHVSNSDSKKQAVQGQAGQGQASLPRSVSMAGMRTLSSRASDISAINPDTRDGNTHTLVHSTDHAYTAPDRASGKFSKILKSGKLSISSVGSLRRRMPSMEDVREPTTWLNKAPEGAEEQEDESLHMSLMENLALLDTFMTLKQQVAVVMLCAYFVVYQAWSSAALSVFSCYFIDSGAVSTSYPSFYAYFQAAAAKNGYWKLNLNQACYEGQHLSVWTPVGVVCSVLVAFGLPVLQFLPVYLNRKRLQEPDVRFRFGRLYLSYFYNRVPYWGAARQLQMLVLIVVQAFSDGLKSPVQQATMLLNTLVLFMVINLAVWPMVSPMLMLMDFLSAAVLIATLSLGIPFSDTNNTIGLGCANTCGALILIINSLYLIVLVFLCGRALMTTSGRKLKTLGGAIKKVASKVDYKYMVRSLNKGSHGSLPKSSSGRSGLVRQASLVQLPTTVPEHSVCD